MMLRFTNYSSETKATFFYFILSLTFVLIFWWNGFEEYQFGIEIGNIATSLASKSQFGDTFGPDTGLTSWAPPFYVSIQAVVFKIFGLRTIESYWASLILNVILMTASFYILCKIDYSKELNHYKFLLLPIYFTLSIFVLIKDFGDYSLTITLGILLVYLFSEILDDSFSKVKYLFYLLAFVLPFSQISLFGGFILLIMLNIGLRIFKKKTFIPINHSALLISISIAMTILWGMRNKQALGAFIPFKSNLWLEFYLSNVQDDDGIIKRSNWMTYHPITDPATQHAYIDLGEVKFMEKYKSIGHEYLKEHWPSYLYKVYRRGLNTFLFVTSSADYLEANVKEFNSVDIGKLNEANLMRWNYWVCLEMPEEKFMNKISTLNLDSVQTILTDWKIKRGMVHNELYKSPKNVIGGIILSTFPSLAILLCLLIRPLRENKVFLLNLFFFLISIGPYILISHYARYQVLQIAFFSVFIFISGAYLLSHNLSKVTLLQKFNETK